MLTSQNMLPRTRSPEDNKGIDVIKIMQHRVEEAVEEEKHEHDFEENVSFARAEQFGSRAVGGHKPQDERLYGQIESADYLVPDTQLEEAYQRTFTPVMRTRRRLFIWGLYACLGFAVAMQIVYVLMACEKILKQRVAWTNVYLKDKDFLGAWLMWTGTSMVLCGCACVLVLWQPAAASSGIPGLIAFLNGTHPIGGTSPLTGKKTGFLSKETLLAKTTGMILSIPSGLCLGPEGPIIHIGALLAHHTTQFFQTLSHKLLPDRFHFDVKGGEARDFLATGAAVGICVAFRAPLAGCLFVVEEAASFFTVEHLEYTFFATIIAYMVALYLSEGQGGASFTKFKQTTGPFCSLYDAFDMLLFIAIAVMGGCTGALFNQIVEHLNHWRSYAINAHIRTRVLELVILVLVSGTVSVFLPAFYECEHPTRSMMMEDSIGCLSEEDTFQISSGQVSHTALTELLGHNNETTEKQMEILELLGKYRTPADTREDADWKDMVWLDNAEEHKHIHLHYQLSYTCDDGDYNGMSMLWLQGGVKAAKVLMQRGFPHMLSWQVLAVFFVCYFFLAAYTSGVAVPAGLIIPHLLIGGSMGRAFGLLGIAEKKAMCTALADLEEAAATDTIHYSTLNFTGMGEHGRLFLASEGGDPTDWMYDNTYFWSTVYRTIASDCKMPDPGMYAVVGMSAFLSGSGRITLMLATVIIELTDDASLIGPVGVAAIIAMIVGNLFNHGLYHGLIPVMNMPFLNSEPADVMNLVQVSDVMERDVICLSKNAKMTEIESLIRKCDSGEVTHHAFPVVEQEIQGKLRGKTLRGIISLQDLRLASKNAKALGNTGTNRRRNRFVTGSEPVTSFRTVDMDEGTIELLSEWLLHVPLMHDLSPSMLSLIAIGMKIGDVPANQEVIHVGEPGDAMYFLERGSADAVVRNQSVFKYEKAGSFFGELALLADEPRKATVRAGGNGVHIWKLDRSVFEEALSLSDRDIKLLNFADRSPITTVPHAKVARAFEVFRKLGMRHMCVVDDRSNLVGIVTRKDLMTFKIAENIMTPRTEALIRGFLYRWRKRHDGGKTPGSPKIPRGMADSTDFEYDSDGTRIEKPERDRSDSPSGGSRNSSQGGDPTFDTVPMHGVKLGVKMGTWRAKAAIKGSGTTTPRTARAKATVFSLEAENAELRRQLDEMSQSHEAVGLERQASNHEDEQARAAAASSFMEDDDDDVDRTRTGGAVEEDEPPARVASRSPSQSPARAAAPAAAGGAEKSKAEEKAGLAAALAAIRAGNVPVPAVALAEHP